MIDVFKAVWGPDPVRYRGPRVVIAPASGNVTFADRPPRADRVPLTGTVDHVIADIASAAATGATEVIIDLSLQPWFSTTARMLEVAQEIRERVREARI